MIDIHCHILPGVDDGAQDMEQALELARALVADGTSAAVATPHAFKGLYEATDEEVRAAYDALRDELARQGIPLRLELGREKAVADIDVAEIAQLRACAITPAGRYLLVETSLVEPPPMLAEVLFRVALGGFAPIVAHPERVVAYQRRPSLFEPLARQRILAQLDAASLLGRHGRLARRTARTFLQRGWAQLVASDAHGPGRKYYSLRAAAEVAASWLGEEAARVLTEDNPAAVLEGREVREIPCAARGRGG